MNISIPTLIEELKSEDIKKRINSIKHLTHIGSALGPERTRSELIPFISTELLDDEDEVLILLAEVLGNFIEYVGGQGYCRILLPLLESICLISDEQVREKTVISLKKMIPKNEDYFVLMMKKFYISEYYSCRLVCLEILPYIFNQLSPITQIEIMNIYKVLIRDAFPMVRKISAKVFASFINSLTPGQEKDAIEIFQVLLKDEEDFVRLFLIDALISLANFLASSKFKDSILGFYQTLANDISWRIRYSLCDKIKEVGIVLGREHSKNYLITFYIKCLQENEPELRSIAVSNIDGIGILIAQKILDIDEVVTKIGPLLKQLQNDNQGYVRTAMAEHILTLCPVFGKKNTNEIILPIFLTLLKDDEIEVRVNLFKKLNEIVKVLGVNTLSQSIIPGFIELGNDNNWRIRMSTIDQLPYFAKQIGEEFFSEKVLKLISALIQDKIYAVRENMIKIISEITMILGEKWLEKNILDKYLKLAGSLNYLYRETFLFFIQKIANQLSQELITQSMLQILFDLAKDKIANVRMNSSKSLKMCYSRLAEKDKESVKTVLIKLSNDEDLDVKIVSKQCLDSLSPS